MPIAAFADYATADEIIAVFDAAHARLQKDRSRDVFVVVGFHQETAHEFASRLRDAMQKLRARPELAGGLVFTTVEDAAERARHVVSPAPL
jgi:predicted RNA-binding protein with PIN domain